MPAIRFMRSNRLLASLATLALAAGGATWTGCDDEADEATKTAKEVLEKAGEEGEKALKQGEKRLNKAEKQAEDAIGGY